MRLVICLLVRASCRSERRGYALGGSGLFVLGMAGHADRPASGRLERGSSKPSSQRYTINASL